MSPVLLVILIVVVVFAIIAVVFLALQRVATARAQAARERFPNAKMIFPSANFYGQESQGVMQLRGNGTLVLTDSELYFGMWLPQREFHIPISAIEKVETPTSFLGKTNFRPLVKVVYRNEAGQTDAMAWLVQNVEGLKGAIEAAMK